MKILNFILLSVFLLQSNLSFAAVNKTEIDTAFKKLQYEMEQASFQTEDDLRERTLELLKPMFKCKLTTEQVVDYVKGKLKSEATRQDFQNLIKAMKKQELPETMIMDKVIQYFVVASNEGASYESGMSDGASIAIIVGAMMAVSLMVAVSQY